LHLGITTDTYDCEGEMTQQSSLIPSFEEIEKIMALFQGNIEQIPPMYSAKKVQGKKLYELARQGLEVERKAVSITVQIEILNYSYPHLDIYVKCSKGTYIRSLAYDIGMKLGCGAHLSALKRTKSGSFSLENCVDGALLGETLTSEDLQRHLLYTL
jgi:tRNA pseudouridine55 synthase